MSIEFQFYPRSQGILSTMQQVIDCFDEHSDSIDSAVYDYSSNEVLEILRPSLEQINYKVESGKKRADKIPVPVLFGRNNSVNKYFYADAINSDNSIVIEVEAVRAVDNNQFLKDIFQACMMCEVEYLFIAVRRFYRGQNDFDKVSVFLETLYVSNRLNLPLKGILLIGY